MPPQQHHIIKNANLRVEFESNEVAMKERTKLPDFFNLKVLPQIEKVLDSYSSADQLITIDRLEVDLGNISIGSDEPGFDTQISSLFLQKLNSLTSSAKTIQNTTKATTDSYFQFLETGHFDSYPGFNSINSIENLLRELEGPEKKDFLSTLKDNLKRNDVRKRMIYQHSEDFLDWVINELQPQLLDAMRIVSQELSPEPGHMQKMEASLIFLSRLTPQLDNVNLTKSLKDITETLTSDDVKNFQDTKETDVANQTKSANTYFVANAGIVLLHPFLVPLLSTLDLLDANQNFKNIEAQIRSIHLLHYLAIGPGDLEEHQAPLYKVICGLDISHPIPKSSNIQPNEIAESDSVLSSTINHWKAIKNTSQEGLREGFLQREGKLELKNGNWSLKVAESSIDILLDQLPWALSIIKMPWNNNALRVEWT